MMTKLYLILIIAVALSNASFISPLMSIMVDSCQNQSKISPRFYRKFKTIVFQYSFTYIGS